MPEYDNNLSGVLFPNDKRGNDRAPDFTGKAEIEGTEYRLAAWKRQSTSTGKRFLSITFEDQAAREAALAESEEGDPLDI